MIFPLVILSFFSIFSGMMFTGYFFGINSIVFWSDSIVNISNTDIISSLQNIPIVIKKLPLLMVLLGFFTSIFLCLFFKNINSFLKKKFHFVFFFLQNKWFIDELYEFTIVRSIKYLGNGFWKSIDRELIDNIGPNGISKMIKKVGAFVSFLQTGYLYHYALTVIVGLTIFISIYFYNI